MKPLRCGCQPSARWCAYAEFLQDALEDAIVARNVAITTLQLDEAHRRFDQAQRELSQHLREAA